MGARLGKFPPPPFHRGKTKLKLIFLSSIMLSCFYQIWIFVTFVLGENSYSDEDNDRIQFSFLSGVSGGVLPVRRFTIVGGQLIQNITTYSENRRGGDATIMLEKCNTHCLRENTCDAWEYRRKNQTCFLFADTLTNPLEIHQSPNNDPNYTVGFLQRRAGIIRQRQHSPNSNDEDERIPISKRILYILHFHHEIIPQGYERILKEVLPRSWTMGSFMDLTVISPREVSLLVDFNGSDANSVTAAHSTSLVNPFRAVSDTSRRGANSHMSIPLAMARFPGYGGYLLVNDDAMLRLWDLQPEVWLQGRPWGTFSPSIYSPEKQRPRQIKTRYPYGPYGYSWYNYDSGAVVEKLGITRSNFDAALDAMNELCKNETGILPYMNDELRVEFCGNRSETTLLPYFGFSTKSDIMYLPGTGLGATMAKALALFGEHDVFLEFAYPMTMNVIVPKNLRLEMPLCDGSVNTLKDNWKPDEQLEFKPFFKLTMEEGKTLVDCPTIHPIKFGKDTAMAYWKKVLQNHCGSACNLEERVADNFWELLT